MTNNNPLQPGFINKELLVDSREQVIPQYFKLDEEVFHPNSGGDLLTASSDPNPYQPEMISKTLIVDKRGRPIPQYYNTSDGFFYPVTSDQSGGGGGPLPTGLVRSVNSRTPDLQGNVNTDYHIIDPLGPDVPPSDYPLGATEFYMDYDPDDYTQYIIDNPSMEQLKEGKICVRTFRENGFAYQQVDNVKDGIFDAAYVRVNVDADTWGELKVAGGGSQGPKGDDGAPGSKWYIGMGEPSPGSLFNNQDYYLDRETGEIYQYHSGTWYQVNANIKGSKWWVEDSEPPKEYPVTTHDYWLNPDNGEIAVFLLGNWIPLGKSLKGESGSKWFVDTIEPTDISTLDYWLNPTTGDVKYFNGTLWVNSGNLKGPPGDEGESGADGTIWHVGSAMPIPGVGKQGDYWLNPTTGDVKYFNGILWVNAGNLKGPQGEKGDPGDVSNLPIVINNEFDKSASPTTYQVGHTISLIKSGDVGFSDLLSEINVDFSTELDGFDCCFIVETVKSETNMTHQEVRCVTRNRGSLLATLYRFSESTFYGFSSWYSQTHTLVGRGVPGDGGRGEGINGNLYVNINTGKVYAKSGTDKDLGYTNWKVVGPNVLSVTDSPTPPTGEDYVYSAESIKEMIDTHENKKASTTVSGHVKVDGTTITDNDGTISVPNASLTSRGVVQLYNSITSNSTVAATPSAVNSAIIAHSDVMASSTVLGHVKVDGTTITATNGVISAVSASVPDATTSTKGIVQLASSVTNATNLATTPAAVQNAINAHVSIIPTTSIRGHLKPDGVTTFVDGTGTISAKQQQINEDTRPVKMWAGSTTTSGGEGLWSIDYTSAGFTQIRTIQVTMESNITAAADKPLGTYVTSKTLTGASGKAYKATSAGLLTAMQQIAADNGVTINILVIGH